jgi:hypothetical protein
VASLSVSGPSSECATTDMCPPTCPPTMRLSVAARPLAPTYRQALADEVEAGEVHAALIDAPPATTAEGIDEEVEALAAAGREWERRHAHAEALRGGDKGGSSWAGAWGAAIVARVHTAPKCGLRVRRTLPSAGHRRQRRGTAGRRAGSRRCSARSSDPDPGEPEPATRWRSVEVDSFAAPSRSASPDTRIGTATAPASPGAPEAGDPRRPGPFQCPRARAAEPRATRGAPRSARWSTGAPSRTRSTAEVRHPMEVA